MPPPKEATTRLEVVDHIIGSIYTYIALPPACIALQQILVELPKRSCFGGRPMICVESTVWTASLNFLEFPTIIFSILHMAPKSTVLYPFRYTRLNHKITPCLIGIFGMSNCRSQEPQKKNLREFRPKTDPLNNQKNRKGLSVFWQIEKVSTWGVHQVVGNLPSCWGNPNPPYESPDFMECGTTPWRDD